MNVGFSSLGSASLGGTQASYAPGLISQLSGTNSPHVDLLSSCTYAPQTTVQDNYTLSSDYKRANQTGPMRAMFNPTNNQARVEDDEDEETEAERTAKHNAILNETLTAPREEDTLGGKRTTRPSFRSSLRSIWSPQKSVSLQEPTPTFRDTNTNWSMPTVSDTNINLPSMGWSAPAQSQAPLYSLVDRGDGTVGIEPVPSPGMPSTNSHLPFSDAVAALNQQSTYDLFWYQPPLSTSLPTTYAPPFQASPSHFQPQPSAPALPSLAPSRSATYDQSQYLPMKLQQQPSAYSLPMNVQQQSSAYSLPIHLQQQSSIYPPPTHTIPTTANSTYLNRSDLNDISVPNQTNPGYYSVQLTPSEVQHSFGATTFTLPSNVSVRPLSSVPQPKAFDYDLYHYILHHGDSLEKYAAKQGKTSEQLTDAEIEDCRNPKTLSVFEEREQDMQRCFEECDRIRRKAKANTTDDFVKIAEDKRRENRAEAAREAKRSDELPDIDFKHWKSEPESRMHLASVTDSRIPYSVLSYAVHPTDFENPVFSTCAENTNEPDASSYVACIVTERDATWNSKEHGGKSTMIRLRKDGDPNNPKAYEVLRNLRAGFVDSHPKSMFRLLNNRSRRSGRSARQQSFSNGDTATLRLTMPRSDCTWNEKKEKHENSERECAVLRYGESPTSTGDDLTTTSTSGRASPSPWLRSKFGSIFKRPSGSVDATQSTTG